ncbi:translation factor [Lophium mytilinum]|uniref:Threonylcarbamoyl-AMP synthase n=1 Tax=Lophium mytilinum TaxID=390894 RepID=A0A6A6QX23_9PEZI|nr:translation factor [Lophium mytilinum]
MKTDILQVDTSRIGEINTSNTTDSPLDNWDIKWAVNTPDLANLQRAASELRTTNTPVAFPTETVYGLGADATRSAAVLGIFEAKKRPADNPLIVHFHSLQQLRTLLQPTTTDGTDDPIPAIYAPLIQRFWPGPLTLILPNPPGSALAPEVTAGLQTFGARMPRSLLALCLIKLAGVPLAAPSANASTRPSPTAAEHVKDDLDGRIHTILDGGPCGVGVESTVVDGLSSPPSILRPGGITLEQLRQCPGWEGVVVGYKDKPEQEGRPRAPGMKYRHYSPKATVALFEAGAGQPDVGTVLSYVGKMRRIGIIRTKVWKAACGLAIWDIDLGAATAGVARGLFSALRELDKHDVDAIFVEGVDDTEGDIATAVMNRLRKAAEVRI